VASFDVAYAQSAGSPEEVPMSAAAAVGFALLVALAVLLPFLIWRRTRRWAAIAAGLLWLGQVAGMASEEVLRFYSEVGMVALGLIAIAAGLAVVPGLFLLWRRTRRVGLVLLGTSIIGVVAFANYWAVGICSIGYVLLLLALWPRWRLMQGAPRGWERAAVIPSRGVLRARPWPACRRPGAEGFSLVSTMVGIICLVIAASIAAQMISATMAAVRRADHLAVATDLLESARERSLLGREVSEVEARGARLLPKGQVTVGRGEVRPGLMRMTAVATWREANGSAGYIALEWLEREGPR
jgi:hypothetical protein